MTLYRYTAIGRDGDRITGDVEAESRDDVLQRLTDLGHYPVEASEVAPGSARRGAGAHFGLTRAPSASQITLLTREIAMLLKAGLTLSQALAMLEEETDQPRLSRLVGRIRAGIAEGNSLHEALAACGPAFSRTYVNMVQVAEASGTLDAALWRIAEAREHEHKQRAKALSALFYPGLLVLTAISAIVIILVFVVPRFKDMLGGAGAAIPESTRVIIAVSDWLIAYGLQLAVGVLALVVALVFLWQRSGARRLLDPALLRLPLVGHLIRIGLTARLCRTLGTLLANGVGLPEALRLTREVIDHQAAVGVLDRMGEALRKGRDFTEPLSESSIFPSLVVNMFKVGGESGRLADTSLYLAQMFEEKLDTVTQRLFTILEPVIIIFVSLFVAGIVVSIIGAVLSINDLAI